MKQIILNYIYIVVIPMIIGFAVRFFCRRIKKAHLITMAFIILTIIAWVAANIIPSYGSELYGLMALQATSAAFASLVTGLAIRLKARK